MPLRRFLVRTKHFFSGPSPLFNSEGGSSGDLPLANAQIDFLERITCKNKGDVLYSFETGFGLRSKVLLGDSGFIYCIDEPRYASDDIRRALNSLIALVKGEPNTLLDLRNILGPSNLEEYIKSRIVTGLDVLYPLTLDPEIEEIALNRPGEALFVYHRKLGMWLRTNVTLNEPKASRIALSMSNLIGRPISLANPIAEGSTKLGLRFAVTLGDKVSPRGTSFVVRKIPRTPLSVPELINSGLISPSEASYLWFLLEKRGFIVILGGMATGKTTLLQALLDLLPGYYRIVTIEDTPEINLTHPNWDSLAIHRGFSIGSSVTELSMFDLAKFALRRRSDLLVIGEVRGEEAKVLFQASITGHGSLCLPPDEKLLTMDSEGNVRPMTIKSIVEKIAVGEPPRVLSFGANATSRWEAPSQFVIALTRRWITLEAENGSVLKATPDHLVPVVTKGRTVYKRADEIRIGERLIFVKRVDGLHDGERLRLEYFEVTGKKMQKEASLAYDLTLSGGYHLMVHGSGVVTHNCSFHAEDVGTALTRLSSPPISIPISSIKNIWSFVTLGFRGGSRKVVDISETDPYQDELLIRSLRFPPGDGGYDAEKVIESSARLRKVAQAHGISREELLDEISLRVELLSSLARRKASASETREHIESFYALRQRGK